MIPLPSSVAGPWSSRDAAAWAIPAAHPSVRSRSSVSSRSLACVPCAFRRAPASRRVIARSRGPSSSRRPAARSRASERFVRPPSDRPASTTVDPAGVSEISRATVAAPSSSRRSASSTTRRVGSPAVAQRVSSPPSSRRRNGRSSRLAHCDEQCGLSVPDRGDDGDNRVRPGGTKAVDEGGAKCRRRGRVRPLHWTPHVRPPCHRPAPLGPLLLPRLRAYRPTLGFGLLWEVFHIACRCLRQVVPCGTTIRITPQRRSLPHGRPAVSTRVNRVTPGPAVTGNTR